MTRWLILQKARRHGAWPLRLLVGTRFQVLFHSPLGVLFTFPSRYWFAIGHRRVFSLGGWSPQVPAGFHVPGGTRVPASRGDGFRVRGSHPLRPAFPDRSTTPTHVTRGPYYPEGASTPPVWAAPLSLTTTRGITVVFSSSAYLDVSVRRVRLPTLRDDAPSARRVAPFGNPRIYGHLRLPAAYRSLSRPSSPPRA